VETKAQASLGHLYRTEGKRYADGAVILVELLINALQHSEVASVDSDLKTRREQLREELKQCFINALSDRASRAHQQIIEGFRHRRVTPDSTAELLIDAGLVSEDIWGAFGRSSTFFRFRSLEVGQLGYR
jgi:hypothetical protein